MVEPTGVTPAWAVVIRPKRSLMRSGSIAIVVASVPLFGVLYWLSVSQGSWRMVLAVQVLFLAAWLFAWLRFRAVFVRVDDQLVTKQAFLRRSAIRRTDVAVVVIAETYRGSSPDTIPQLLAIDADGRRMFRLRGHFWSREDMLAVAAAIEVTTMVDDQPVSRREFYRLHPGAAYWYEGRTWLQTVGIVVAFAVAAAMVSWLMTAIGSPTTLNVIG